MDTDASNVEDTNIHHFLECLLLSCVVCFEDWSWIFRTRSFTLCKNDRDFDERSDSVAVLESLSSSSTRNWSVCSVNKPGGCSLTGLTVLASNISSDFHSWEELRSSWLSCLVSHAVEAITLGFLTLHRQTKFIIGFDFAVTLSSPQSFRVLFDTLTLNKHKRWFHSSRVKFPLVSMSASWFVVSMYLIRILGSKLILSNNQSRATLWVLETCPIVGLLPLMIILITASLSSNIYNRLLDAKIGRLREHGQHYSKRWTFLEIAGLARDLCHGRQRVSPFYHGSESCFQGLIKPSDPRNQERVFRPTSILRPEKWFLILLNCAKMKFVSYTSNWMEQMYDFPKRTMM